MSKRRKQSLPLEPVRVHIESLTHDGRGVAHIDGKTVFIDGALPGEDVEFTYLARQRRYDEGKVARVLTSSPQRVQPPCIHFGVCGGCSLQHLNAEAQIHAKQQVLLDNLKHIAQLVPETVLPPLMGPSWGYRRKARLAVKYVLKKEKMMVGFREKHSHLVADIQSCAVLHPAVDCLLPELVALVGALSIRDKVPQIEVAVGDEAIALILRHLEAFNEADMYLLLAFARAHRVQLYLQPAGLDSVHLLWPEQAVLSYRLEKFGVEFRFKPTLFTQVNADINRLMLERAVELLELRPTDRVLDLFCGLGNFTLPIARYAGHVTGVEGDAGLVQTARDNATYNTIVNAEFHVANLMEDVQGSSWAGRSYDKILLDPPRSGAYELVQQTALWKSPRLVYVSCNSATLARDANILVNTQGYRLVSTGVMDMFPHTAHVEAIALFVKR